jgi:hypothetical protein
MATPLHSVTPCPRHPQIAMPWHSNTKSSPHVMLPSNCAGTVAVMSGLRVACFWCLSVGYYTIPCHVPSWRWRQQAPPERYSKLIILRVVITRNLHLWCLSIAARWNDLEVCRLNDLSITTRCNDIEECHLNDLSFSTRCSGLEVCRLIDLSISTRLMT